MLKWREAGALLPVSSLPGPYGVGVMGKEALRFAGRLKESGLSVWQILPLAPSGAGNSPYSPLSLFAGDPIYLDPEKLGMPNETCPGPLYSADYGWARQSRMRLARQAFLQAGKDERSRAERWAEETNVEWLPDYAMFMALREKLGPDWTSWPAAFRDRDQVALRRFSEENADKTAFWRYVQYLFFTQWQELKEQVNRRGIRILGDLSIYPCLDSADVWAHSEWFSLDQKKRPLWEAGTPPDYFAPQGQLWGNPIYNWEQIESDGYRFWHARIEQALRMFDGVRIDHFRGFARYWAVPAGSKSAGEGRWMAGPGEKLFAPFSKAGLVAEDLGEADPRTKVLLQKTGIPGTRVLQFGMEAGPESEHLPHNYPQNCVAYTGTHDNNTWLGWLWEATEQTRAFVLKYCGVRGDWGKGGIQSESCRAALRTLWQSPARLVIAPVQDLCGFGADTRMNIPGAPKGEWTFRLGSEAMEHGWDVDWLRELCEIYGRTGQNKNGEIT